MLTYGELFAGAGGFGLGFDRAGMECRWQVEIDPWCQSVLRRHWPDVPRYLDVHDVGAHNLEPVDVISFGSPCQDLSVAGNRAGLSGERSGLFHEAVRIIGELHPAYAVWENVPGALSSNGGRDFGAILDALADCGAVDICWRILDARFFGVPQRRRRLFVVSSFRPGASAYEVLVEPESCGGHPPTRRETDEDAAFTLRGGTANARGLNSPQAWNTDFVASADRASDGHHGHSSPRGDGADNLIAFQPNSSRTHEEWREDQSPPIKKGSGGNGAVPPAISGLAGVRRLTPLECERLMGWPDEHTRYAADGREIPDSHRYRLCGNGVVAPVAEWLGHRLMAV